MSPNPIHHTDPVRLQQTVPDGKRLIIRDASGNVVVVFEPGQVVTQQLPPGHATELVDLQPIPTPQPPASFNQIPTRLAIEALVEVLGVNKQDILARALSIRSRTSR